MKIDLILSDFLLLFSLSSVKMLIFQLQEDAIEFCALINGRFTKFRQKFILKPCVCYLTRSKILILRWLGGADLYTPHLHLLLYAIQFEQIWALRLDTAWVQNECQSKLSADVDWECAWFESFEFWTVIPIAQLLHIVSTSCFSLFLQ